MRKIARKPHVLRNISPHKRHEKFARKSHVLRNISLHKHHEKKFRTEKPKFFQNIKGMKLARGYRFSLPTRHP